MLPLYLGIGRKKEKKDKWCSSLKTQNLLVNDLSRSALINLIITSRGQKAGSMDTKTLLIHKLNGLLKHHLNKRNKKKNMCTLQKYARDHSFKLLLTAYHWRLAFSRRTWDWYMYDAHLQRTLACGWKGKTTDFRVKKRKLLSQGRTYLKLKC